MLMPGWLARSWYSANYCGMMAVYTLAFSLRFEGSRNVPRRGPVLLIANHQSFLDPVAIGLAVTGRQVAFLGRKTLFGHRLFGAFLSSVGVVPVDQEGIAKEGLQQVLNLLDQGRCVLVFPEGERTETGKMQPLKPGISLLVRKSGAPVVPVGIAGAFEAYPRWATLPVLSPLFPPTRHSGVAVSIGKAHAPEEFAGMGRDEMLAALALDMAAVQRGAERLRRNA
jgi:1-acyl-sn-glycerol-3-phosphate acyltransferase